MDTGLVTMLLGVILTAIISQTAAVWVKFSNLEKKIEGNKCPFGSCPVFRRAQDEAMETRDIIKT